MRNALRAPAGWKDNKDVKMKSTLDVRDGVYFFTLYAKLGITTMPAVSALKTVLLASETMV